MHIRYTAGMEKGKKKGVIAEYSKPIAVYGRSQNHEVPFVPEHPWANLVENVSSRNRMVRST